MHPHRLQQLVSSVPADISAEQRGRLDACVATCELCRERIDAVKAEILEVMSGPAGAPRAIELASELETLGKVQQRVDGWLTSYVEDLSTGPVRVRYDDGVPV